MIADLNVGILYIFAISSLGVYGVIMGGWASNSKYSFLGGLRSAAQMVSYEVSIGFVLVTVLICVGSLNLGDVVRVNIEAKHAPGTVAVIQKELELGDAFAERLDQRSHSRTGDEIEVDSY